MAEIPITNPVRSPSGDAFKKIAGSDQGAALPANGVQVPQTRITHNKLIVQVKHISETGGKMSPEVASNFERVHRRQKANNSLLIPSERIAKMQSFN